MSGHAYQGRSKIKAFGTGMIRIALGIGALELHVVEI